MGRPYNFGFRWGKTKKKWVRENPPDERGYYICAYCGHDIEPARLSLDHILKVADFPELAFKLSNVQPMHRKCNSKRDRLMTDPNYIRRIAGVGAHNRHRHLKVLHQAQEAYKAHTKAPTTNNTKGK